LVVGSGSDLSEEPAVQDVEPVTLDSESFLVCPPGPTFRSVQPAGVSDEDGIVDWWAAAGGWAIDCWLDTESREHHDIEVVIRRCDQRIVHEAQHPVSSHGPAQAGTSDRTNLRANVPLRTSAAWRGQRLWRVSPMASKTSPI